MKGWQPCPASKTDPPLFTHRDYRPYRAPWLIPLAHSKDSNSQWIWAGDWDHQGWKYAKKWTISSSNQWTTDKKSNSKCRQRIWRRPRVRLVKHQRKYTIKNTQQQHNQPTNIQIMKQNKNKTMCEKFF